MQFAAAKNCTHILRNNSLSKKKKGMYLGWHVELAMRSTQVLICKGQGEKLRQGHSVLVKYSRTSCWASWCMSVVCNVAHTIE